MLTRYLWDYATNTCLAEMDEQGETLVDYTVDPQTGELISERREGESIFHRYDGDGNTRQTADSAGNVLGEATYDAFGETVAESGDMKTTYRFQGQRGFSTDPLTGDVSKANQNYSPSLGRRLSLASFGFHAFGQDTYTGREWEPASGEEQFQGVCLSFSNGDAALILPGGTRLPIGPARRPPLLPRRPVTVPPPTHRHPGIRRCIFVLEPYKVQDFFRDPYTGAPYGAIRGDVIEGVKDPWVIPREIASRQCCEILILGHQGAPTYVGGATAKVGETKIPILPSPTGAVERQIRDALQALECPSCRLFFYTCGGGDQTAQDLVRKRIAAITGCHVFGPKVMPVPLTPKHAEDLGVKHICSLNPDLWGKCSQTMPPGFPSVPFPLVHYPPPGGSGVPEYWRCIDGPGRGAHRPPWYYPW